MKNQSSNKYILYYILAILAAGVAQVVLIFNAGNADDRLLLKIEGYAVGAPAVYYLSEVLDQLMIQFSGASFEIDLLLSEFDRNGKRQTTTLGSLMQNVTFPVVLFGLLVSFTMEGVNELTRVQSDELFILQNLVSPLVYLAFVFINPKCRTPEIFYSYLLIASYYIVATVYENWDNLGQISPIYSPTIKYFQFPFDKDADVAAWFAVFLGALVGTPLLGLLGVGITNLRSGKCNRRPMQGNDGADNTNANKFTNGVVQMRGSDVGGWA